MQSPPSLNLSSPRQAAIADTRPTEGEAVRVLLIPNARRLLITTVLWSLLTSLYSRAMEVQGVDAPQQYGLGMYLSTNLGGGLIVLTVVTIGWYAVASRVWLGSEAARRRYAMEGAYALLPWKVYFPLLVLLSTLGGTLSYMSFVHYMHATQAWSPVLERNINWGANVILTLIYSFGIFSMDYFRVRAQMLRIRAETAQRLNVEARLQRLQAQMEPHMLFNTLANLHALIDTQPAKAQDMLAHLIDYLRATLSASRTGAVSLRDEMARVQDYLALMQIRMGERLQIVIDVPAELHAVQLPPMLIQPLVENAIKHGLDPLPEGGTLHIQARRNNDHDRDQIEIAVRDDGQGLDAAQAIRGHAQKDSDHNSDNDNDSGFGLGCIRARLQASYGDNARLILEPGQPSRHDTPGHRPGTVAILRLPAKPPAALLADEAGAPPQPSLSPR
jgi:signal transduction histidine kinase